MKLVHLAGFITKKKNTNQNFILHTIDVNNIFENPIVCEIMWKNSVQPSKPQMIIWLMLIGCWIPKVKNTHSKYAILIAFLLQQWLHERTSVLRYMYIACLFKSFFQFFQKEGTSKPSKNEWYILESDGY